MSSLCFVSSLTLSLSLVLFPTFSLLHSTDLAFVLPVGDHLATCSLVHWKLRRRSLLFLASTPNLTLRHRSLFQARSRTRPCSNSSATPLFPGPSSPFRGLPDSWCWCLAHHHTCLPWYPCPSPLFRVALQRRLRMPVACGIRGEVLDW